MPRTCEKLLLLDRCGNEDRGVVVVGSWTPLLHALQEKRSRCVSWRMGVEGMLACAHQILKSGLFGYISLQRCPTDCATS